MYRQQKFKKSIKKLLKSKILLALDKLTDVVETEILFKTKKQWVRPWMARRQTHGASVMLLDELSSEDKEEYRNCMRMNKNQFQILLEKIKNHIQRHDTIMREAIPAKIKLEITLSFLATGNSFRNLQQQYRVSSTSISKFVPEVCDAIWIELQDFIKVPNAHELKNIEKGFRLKWNFPNCYGAIDGKHILIRKPAHSGSEYFNYKGTNSIVLLAVVDDNYCFSYIGVGCNGSVSDGGVFRNSSMYIIDVVENDILPAEGFIVGDNAFPLKHYLLTPFSRVQLTKEQKIFNYRLSRARRIVENAFGILASRFRVFEKPIPCDVSVTDKIVKACCAIHNWLRITCTNTYMPQGSVDEEDLNSSTIIEGNWRVEVDNSPRVRNRANHSSNRARALREKYMNYFMQDGAVPWQEKMISL